MKFTSKLIYQGLIGLSVVMLISGWQLGFADNTEVISKDSVTIAKVERGDFSIKVDGYGSLQSINKRLLTATSNAVVDEIKLKAGAVVNHDTVILTLNNPELESKLRLALAKLKNAKTQKRQTVLLQQRELLNNESTVSELKAQSEIAMLQVEAERTLAKSGIVSGISAKKNELEAKQLSKRINLEESKLDKLAQMQKESLSIQDDLIAQAQDEFDVAKLMVEQLSVKAGMNGVIQRLPLSLGQSVSAGSELALIGSLSPLVGEIKVPQIQAHLIQIGMTAQISTLNDQVRGQVVRVDPVISEGAVQIDIELEVSESDTMKPMQQVDATIFADVQKEVNYIKQPTGASEGSYGSLFKLTMDNKAVKVEVQYGKASGQLIQVLSGLEPGEQVIISTLDIPAETTTIKIAG
ncbi:efflux RND transporter periplasmic adaptor subunit [Pseudoalteromonas sp. SG44-8]|uniref:efflux RND transporter periplasmic adaptor subunit n=1 Tax=Pseudoalteromonas sp. SG44-8 TaxID=2760958 RepID=UPI0016005C44|nr:HlyD family efflux transporter periplasmic adaptor subunit [Pseudoalteromonas sp. SG44-8]MBB1397862.1 HlyD family efflux transporter periplasmic adaptor subunit [Pseudoalteromonas sp. SG44-8]